MKGSGIGMLRSSFRKHQAGLRKVIKEMKKELEDNGLPVPQKKQRRETQLDRIEWKLECISKRLDRIEWELSKLSASPRLNPCAHPGYPGLQPPTQRDDGIYYGGEWVKRAPTDPWGGPVAY